MISAYVIRQTVAIGKLVVGGTPNSVLFIDPNGKLAQDSNLTFDNVAKVFQAKRVIGGISGSGTAAAPSLSVQQGDGTSGLGLFEPSLNVLAVSVAGTEAWDFTVTGLAPFADNSNTFGSHTRRLASANIIAINDVASINLTNGGNVSFGNPPVPAFDNTGGYTLGTHTLRWFGANIVHLDDLSTVNATTGSSVVFATSISIPGGTLITTTSALTNNAGASAGTLTNAPSVGDPTKWIPINDNGTIRNIPAW